MMAGDRGLTLSSDFVDGALGIFSQQRTSPDFANARAVRELLDDATRRQAARLASIESVRITPGHLQTLEASDLPPMPDLPLRIPTGQRSGLATEPGCTGWGAVSP